MLTIFSVSITIYLQQLHLNLIYIDMHQDGINYSQIHLYQNTSNKYDTHIIHKYVDGPEIECLGHLALSKCPINPIKTVH